VAAAAARNAAIIDEPPDEPVIMALHHVARPLFGLQFHPESIISEHGHALLKNFIELRP